MMKRRLLLHRPAGALAIGVASSAVAFQHHPHASSSCLHPVLVAFERKVEPKNNNCFRRRANSNNNNCYGNSNCYASWIDGREPRSSRSRSSPLFLSDRAQTLDLQPRNSNSGGKLAKSTSTNKNNNSQNQQLQQLQGGAVATEGADAECRRGLLTIGFITLLFSSMSPALHAALADTSGIGGSSGHGHAPPPVLLLNAVVSVVALCGLVVGGPFLEASTPLPRSLVENRRERGGDNTCTDTDSSDADVNEGNAGTASSRDVDDDDENVSLLNLPKLPLEAQAGLELGLWKMLGTTANLYGLSLTTADHGAFLIQLTTLIVPVVQGIMGVPIPDRIKTAIALALGGVFLFTSDPSAGTCSAAADAATANTNLALGDALCVVAAGFYATYDLRLFEYGKLVKARQLITGKILTQAILSVLLVLAVGYGEAADYLAAATWEDCGTIALLALWAGLAVNAVAPFLQVGGQQAVGPTRAQTLYASQPLWASILSFVFLGETVGRQGFIGGAAFLSALFLAATAEPPEPECGVQNCEV